MTNYYVVLGLDRSASIEELQEELRRAKKKWQNRLTAPSLEKRQEAERMMELLREASEILLVKDKKAKYDRELDKNGGGDPVEPPQPPVYQPQPAPAYSYGELNSAEALDKIEQLYNANNYNQAIALCKQEISAGNNSVDIYGYMVDSYIEHEDINNAMLALQQMIQEHSNSAEAHIIYAAYYLRILEGHYRKAKPSIDWLLNAGYAQNDTVAALDVEYCIDNGDLPLAKKKIDAHLGGNKASKEFGEYVCRAYEQYADQHYRTEYGGDYYFDKQEDFDAWVSMVNMAVSIYPQPNVRKDLNNVLEQKKRTVVPDSWMGILCALIYAIGGFSSGSVALGIVMLLLNGLMIYFSFVPKWQFKRFEYKRHLVGLYEVARYFNIAMSFVLRVCWELVKALFRLAFGIAFNS